MLEMSSVPLPEPPRVIWSLQAKVDLELLVEDPAVRERLERNAEEILHEIEDRATGGHTSKELAAEEGRVGEIMWLRGWTPEQRSQADEGPEEAEDGPWNYVFFFREAAGLAEFEILAVRGHRQIGDWWVRMNSGDWRRERTPSTWRGLGLWLIGLAG